MFFEGWYVCTFAMWMLAHIFLILMRWRKQMFFWYSKKILEVLDLFRSLSILVGHGISRDMFCFVKPYFNLHTVEGYNLKLETVWKAFVQVPGSSKWPRLDLEVTFSGLKWPPFGVSKGHFEEAGTFISYTYVKCSSVILKPSIPWSTHDTWEIYPTKRYTKVGNSWPQIGATKFG